MILVESYIDMGNLDAAKRFAQSLKDHPDHAHMLSDAEISFVDTVLKISKIEELTQ
tara:strand:+ start:889 stop:1056 length:168 start_codon:yes stop_codon:yes gene_type:complete